MKKIYYLGYYDDLRKEIRRNVHLGAVSKMNYIIGVLNSLDFKVEVISLANPIIKGKFPAETVVINKYTNLKLFKSTYKRNKLLRVINRFINKIRYIIYLAFQLKTNDILIVYHSLDNLRLINLLVKFKKLNVIYEVEEIYSDYLLQGDYRNKEIKFLSQANSYIFSNDYLPEIIAKDKPHVVLYGAYNIHKISTNNRFNDGKIHCVYAGGLSETKGGADIVVDSAIYLDKNYHIHLIGIGSKEEEHRIKERIINVNKISKCEVTYGEPLTGKDFDDFLSKFDIGLAIQHSFALMNVTSFPSKLISYLSNGLKVISSNILSVKNSKVSKDIYFVNCDDPYEVAKTIREVSSYNSNTDKIIANLDQTFKKDFKNILNKM